MRMSLWIRLSDVAQGGSRTVALNNHTVEIEVPLGINDGDNVQYQGIAPGGMDLVVQFRVHPDSRWSRDGLNVTTEIPVSIWTMILGGDITVTDILGTSFVTSVPPRTQPRTLLRLRSRGLKNRTGQTGDLLIRVVPVVPDSIRPELIEAIEKYQK